jgi:hypothetical protein
MTLSFPLNLSSYPVAYLEFWHKYGVETGYDYCYVEVSSDNGTTWQNVATYNGTMTTWTKQSFDISSKVNLSGNFRIRFRLTSDGNTQGTGWYVDNIKITNYQGQITGTGNNLGIIPDKYSLGQNYPNPFNPSTSIKFGLSKSGIVKLIVYDVTGKVISTLLNETFNAGEHTVLFNAENLSSGVYYYKLESGNFSDTKKMLLIK